MPFVFILGNDNFKSKYQSIYLVSRITRNTQFLLHSFNTKGALSWLKELTQAKLRKVESWLEGRIRPPGIESIQGSIPSHRILWGKAQALTGTRDPALYRVWEVKPGVSLSQRSVIPIYGRQTSSKDF